MKAMMILPVLLACSVQAQVISYTIGLDVNCPSGLGE